MNLVSAVCRPAGHKYFKSKIFHYFVCDAPYFRFFFNRRTYQQIIVSRPIEKQYDMNFMSFLWRHAPLKLVMYYVDTDVEQTPPKSPQKSGKNNQPHVRPLKTFVYIHTSPIPRSPTHLIIHQFDPLPPPQMTPPPI
jgi:hypothetical protein